jgi:putative holliday junction resolvase
LSKYLGIDFGDKRVGIAISDLNKEIAFPRDFLEYNNENDLLETIIKICEVDNVEKIILGMPIMMSGEHGDRAIKTNEFSSRLQEVLPDIEIEFIDERLSSQYATKMLHTMGIKSKNQKGKRDALSAQIILQNYINRVKR